ncbi:MAG: response regulator, partial [bacterium]
MISQVEKELAKLLVVDDEESIGKMLSRILSHEGYVCSAVQSAKEALAELEREDYSLVISDISMPEMNGVQLLELIAEKDQETAVIMLTGLPDLDTAIHCLKIGAYDYLSKPINTEELLVSVSRALERRSFLIRDKEYQEALEREVKKKTLALEETQKEIIYRLALAAEYRDEDTWEHLLRIAGSSYILAQRLGLPRKFCEMIHTVSPLHDIGKIG